MRSTSRFVTVLAAASLVALLPRLGACWQTQVDDPADVGGSGRAVAFDGAGDVVTAGSTAIPAPPESGFVGQPQFTVAKLRGTDGTRLWRTTLVNAAPLGSGDMATAVTVNAAGTVFAAGLMDGTHGTDFAVAAFDGSTGTELWRTVIDGGASDKADAIAVTADGAVAVAGRLSAAPSNADLALVKLSQSDGSEVWRRVIDVGSDDELTGVAVDQDGDVVAAGWVTNVATQVDLTVLKLRGSDGGVLWRRDLDGTSSRFDRAFAVAVDGAGDVFGAGYTTNDVGVVNSLDFTVAKLAGADGTELWRHAIDIAAQEDDANSVKIDGAGDVVAAGLLTDPYGPPTPFQEFGVVKLSGATGTELWRRFINGTQTGIDIARAVALDAAGDVFASGNTMNVDSFQDFTLVKIAGASGAELWRRVVRGPSKQNPYEDALAVAVDGSGHGAAVGELNRGPGAIDFAVLSPREEVAGDLLRFVDVAGKPSKRKLIVLSSDTGILAGGPSGPSDPTVGGASLELLNPTTGESDVFPLPAPNWHPMGARPGSGRIPTGYVYTDPRLTGGPCAKVELRNGRDLKVRCQGNGITFSLDEPSQHGLGVVLRAGSGATLHCLSFDGKAVTADAPAVPRRGVFEARGVPAPAACPTAAGPPT